MGGSRHNFLPPYVYFLDPPCDYCLAFVVLDYPTCVSKYETMCEIAGPILEQDKE